MRKQLTQPCGCTIWNDDETLGIHRCKMHETALDLLAFACKVSLHFDGADAPLGREAALLVRFQKEVPHA